MVLCDVLTYIGKYDPKVVIDTATLTGAVIVALGSVAAGVMGNDQKLVDKILEAGHASGEKAWQLPLWDEYQSFDIHPIGVIAMLSLQRHDLLQEFCRLVFDHCP